jgi:hypothetical protein
MHPFLQPQENRMRLSTVVLAAALPTLTLTVGLAAAQAGTDPGSSTAPQAEEVTAAYQACQHYREPPLDKKDMSLHDYLPEWRDDCRAVETAYQHLQDERAQAARRAQVRDQVRSVADRLRRQ